MKRINDHPDNQGSYCIHQDDTSGLMVLDFSTTKPLPDYRDAIDLANRVAHDLLGDVMMLSWYDRDRDFESPQHASECHLDSATPGYVDYGISHGANLKLVIEAGRFVFYFTQLES